MTTQPVAASLPVSEVMTAPVLTIRSASTARDAMEVMRTRHVQHLVVVDADGCVEGVLSDGDVRAAQPSVLNVPDKRLRDRALARMRVADIMTRQPHVVTPDTPIAQVLETMLETKVGSIPVVDRSERPVGIVTGFDVLVLTLRLLGGGSGG